MEQTIKRERTCIGCGKKSGKLDFLRIVRSADGEVSFDASGRKAGRGAYVCSLECFDSACKSKRIARALKTNVSEADADLMRNQIEQSLRSVND